jgi:hypothetical protein
MARTPFVLYMTLIVLAVGIGTSCDSTDPSGYDWSGTWSGTATEATAGTGNVEITLRQTGNKNVEGTASILFPALTLTGPASGTVTDTTLTLTVSAAQPVPCSLNVTGVREENTVSGTFSPAACPLPVSGTFRLTKN